MNGVTQTLSASQAWVFTVGGEVLPGTSVFVEVRSSLGSTDEFNIKEDPTGQGGCSIVRPTSGFRICTIANGDTFDRDVLFTSTDGVLVDFTVFPTEPSPDLSCDGVATKTETLVTAASSEQAAEICRSFVPWTTFVLPSPLGGSYVDPPPDLWTCGYELAGDVTVSGAIDCSGDFSGSYTIGPKSSGPADTVDLIVAVRLVATEGGRTYFDSQVDVPSSGSLWNDTPGSGEADPSLDYDMLVTLRNGFMEVSTVFDVISDDSSCPVVDALRFVACDGTDPATSAGFYINSVGGSDSPNTTAAGGTSPYTYSAIGLDSGFSIAADGTVSHVSAAPGTYQYTFVVTDAASDTASVPASGFYNPGGLPATC